MAERKISQTAAKLLKRDWQLAVLFTEMGVQPQLVEPLKDFQIVDNVLLLPAKSGVKNPMPGKGSPLEKYPFVTMEVQINLDHVRVAQFLTGNEIVINQEARKIITMD